MSDEETSTQRPSTKRPRSPSPASTTTTRAAATGPRTPSEDEIRLAADRLLAEANQLFDTPVPQLAISQSAAAPTERTLTEHPFPEAHAWTSVTPLRDVVSPAELKQITNKAILDVNLATWAKEKAALQHQYGADFLLVASSANRAQELFELTELSSHGVSTVAEFVTSLMENDSALHLPWLYMLVRGRCRALAVKFLDLAATVPVGSKPFALTCTDVPFCGDDRDTIVREMIKTTKNTEGYKEATPIHFVVSSPRLGKSRVLAEYAQRVRDELPGVRAIPITFNSQTPIAWKMLRTEYEVHWQVLSRVFLSLMSEHFPQQLKDEVLSDVWRIGGALSWDDVKRFIKKANNGQSTKVVLVADELSKLVDRFKVIQPEDGKRLMSAVTYPLFSSGGHLFASGFLKGDGSALSTASGRTLETHYLAPVQASTRDSYDKLRQLAKEACTAGLYNQIRFVPGLMGLAVENAKKNSGKKQSALYPPLLQDLIMMHPDQKPKTQLEVLAEKYLTHVAAKTDATMLLRLSPEVDMALDKWGVLMRFDHTSDPDAATFVPYYLLHDAGGQHLLSPLKPLLDSNLADRMARGKYFEVLLLVALRLRAKYSLPKSMSVGDLVRLLGGRSLLSVGIGEADDDLVTLGNDNLDADGNARKSFPPIVSFPCHTETTDNVVERSEDDIQKNKANAGAAVRDFGRFVAQPTAKFNKGCDIVQVATLAKGEKLLLLFETRFWQEDSSQPHNVAEKVLLCLIGLLANYHGVFRRAAFVYLTTAGNVPSFNATDLQKARCKYSRSTVAEVKAIRAMGVTLPYNPTLGELVDVAKKVDPNLTFTVHVVACPSGTKDASPEFQSCMMGSLTYVCPDFELVKRATKPEQ